MRTPFALRAALVNGSPGSQNAHQGGGGSSAGGGSVTQPDHGGDRRKGKSKKRKLDEEGVQEGAASSRRCTFSSCECPDHSRRFHEIHMDCSSGGQDWTSLAGSLLCNACFKRFRTTGTLERKPAAPTKRNKPNLDEEEDEQEEEGAASSRRCSQAGCDAPDKSCKFYKINRDSSAGGHDWSSLEGSVLCLACYLRFMRTGTLERSRKTSTMPGEVMANHPNASPPPSTMPTTAAPVKDWMVSMAQADTAKAGTDNKEQQNFRKYQQRKRKRSEVYEENIHEWLAKRQHKKARAQDPRPDNHRHSRTSKSSKKSQAANPQTEAARKSGADEDGCQNYLQVWDKHLASQPRSGKPLEPLGPVFDAKDATYIGAGVAGFVVECTARLGTEGQHGGGQVVRTVLKISHPPEKGEGKREATFTGILGEAQTLGMMQQFAEGALCPRLVKTAEHPDAVLAGAGCVAILMQFIERKKKVGGRLGGEHGSSRETNLPKMIESLLTSVSEMHKGRVVHRDLKSSNIVVDKNGRVTLVDFGGGASPTSTAPGHRVEVAVSDEAYSRAQKQHWVLHPGEYHDLFLDQESMATGERNLHQARSEAPTRIVQSKAAAGMPPMGGACAGKALRGPILVKYVHDVAAHAEKEAKRKANQELKYAESVRVQGIEKLEGIVDARKIEWSKLLKKLWARSRGSIGGMGSACHRAPECVELMARSNVSSSQSVECWFQSALVRSFDVYAVGTIVLEWIVGTNLHTMANEHHVALRLAGRWAAGPHDTSKSPDNRYRLDNALHDWVKTFITDESNLSTIVGTLRKVGRWPVVGPRPRGEGQMAWTNSVNTWKKWAELLKGLLAPTSSTRWTAWGALQHMKASGRR